MKPAKGESARPARAAVGAAAERVRRQRDQATAPPTIDLKSMMAPDPSQLPPTPPPRRPAAAARRRPAAAPEKPVARRDAGAEPPSGLTRHDA